MTVYCHPVGVNLTTRGTLDFECVVERLVFGVLGLEVGDTGCVSMLFRFSLIEDGLPFELGCKCECEHLCCVVLLLCDCPGQGTEHSIHFVSDVAAKASCRTRSGQRETRDSSLWCPTSHAFHLHMLHPPSDFVPPTSTSREMLRPKLQSDIVSGRSASIKRIKLKLANT